MGADNEGIQVAFGANIAGLTNGLSAATGGVKDAVGNMENQFKGLGGTLENLKAPFLAFTGLLAGGSIFKGIISETIGMTGETAKLARQLGISTQEASGLREALDKLGIDTDTYGSAVFKLQIALRTQEAELNRNGVATRNSKGEHMAIQDVMMAGIKRMQQMDKGFDANALAMLMWGRGAKEMQGLMRLTTERIAEGAEETKKLGTAISGDQVAAMRAYKEAMVDVKDIFEAIQVQVGSKLLPSLTSMGQWFATNGAAIIGPTVKAFEALANIMSYTTVQMALLTAALWGPLTAAWAKASTAVIAFGQTMRVQMALGAMEGVTGTRAIIGGLQSMINPWMLAGAVIIGAGIGLERWITSASRAAEEHAHLVQELQKSAGEFTRMSEEVSRYRKVLDDSKATDEEKKRAQQMLGVTIEQLRSLYPQYAAVLTDENIKQKGILGVLKEINVERQKAIRAQIAATEATLAGLKAKEADLIVTSAVAGAWGTLGSVWGAIAGKRADDVSKAIKTMNDDLNKQRDVLKGLLGDSGAEPKKPGAKFKDKEKDTSKEDMEKLRTWKDTLTKQLEAQGAFFNDSTQMSLTYWRGILEGEKTTNKQREAIRHEVFKLEKDLARQEHEAKLETLKAEKDLARQEHEAKLETLKAEMEALQQNTEARLQKQREVVAEELRVHKGRTKEVIAAERELAAIERQVAAEKRALAQQVADFKRDVALAGVETERENLAFQREMGTITAEQEVAQLIQMEQRKADIKHTALTQQLLDLTLTEKQRQAILNEMAMLDIERDRSTQQIKHNLALQQNEDIKGFLAPLTQSMTSAFTGMLSGAMSLREGLSTIWKGLGNMLDQAIAKMVVDWIAAQLRMLMITLFYKKAEVGAHAAGEGAKVAVTSGSVLARVALETWAAMKSIALAIWTGIKWIAIKGYEAAAGAYSAISSIPYVGPFLAPAVAAGTLAAVIGLGAHLASAAGGWETVPHDQMAMIHKDEQVLPASYATGLRQLIKNGGPQQQAAQEVHHHTWNVQTMDASSFEDFLMNKGQGAMVKVQRELVRNGRMG